MKIVQIRSISGPYFPAFGRNAEIYGVNLRIQSKYEKIGTRKNSLFEHFSQVVVRGLVLTLPNSKDGKILTNVTR